MKNHEGKTPLDEVVSAASIAEPGATSTAPVMSIEDGYDSDDKSMAEDLEFAAFLNELDDLDEGFEEQPVDLALEFNIKTTTSFEGNIQVCGQDILYQLDADDFTELLQQIFDHLPEAGECYIANAV
jgi:hypothetical protein